MKKENKVSKIESLGSMDSIIEQNQRNNKKLTEDNVKLMKQLQERKIAVEELEAEYMRSQRIGGLLDVRG